MSVSRKSKNMKISSKSKKRSKNVRRNKKTRKHLKKMSGGAFTEEIELFIQPYILSVDPTYANAERTRIKNIINFMSKGGSIVTANDLMNYFDDENNINKFTELICKDKTHIEFNKYINFIIYVLKQKYKNKPLPSNIMNLLIPINETVIS